MWPALRRFMRIWEKKRNCERCVHSCRGDDVVKRMGLVARVVCANMCKVPERGVVSM